MNDPLENDSLDMKTWRTSELDSGALAAIAFPLDEYDVVHIPYCTGDLHMGNMTVAYFDPQTPIGPVDEPTRGRFWLANHWGYNNIKLDLDKIGPLFPIPGRIVIWGSSAGGLGVDCNLEQILATWRAHIRELHVKVFSMNNSGTPFGSVHTPLVPYVTRVWGAWAPGPDGEIVKRTCPISVAYPGPGVRWSISHIVRYNKLNFPDVRKGLTDDYADYTTAAFACLLKGVPLRQLLQNLQNGFSCEGGAQAVDDTLTDLFYGVIEDATKYKVFYHEGKCHAEREFDVVNDAPRECWFPNLHERNVPFREWVLGWLEGSHPWENVKRPFEIPLP